MASQTTKRKRNAGGRFERCVDAVSKRRGVASPRGVCAAAGRKKYGAKRFAAMAAAGRKIARRNAERRSATLRKSAPQKRNFFGLGRKVKKAKSRLGTGYDVMDMQGYPVHTGTNLTKREALKIAKAARADGEKVRLVRHRVGGVMFVENAGRKKRKTPAKQKQRKNGLKTAEDIYEKFHGRRRDVVLDIIEPMHFHKHLSGIGDLVGMQVLQLNGRAKVTLKFDAGSVLAQNEKRNQLFIRGGDQSVDLKDFGITGPRHESEVLGLVIWISYYTRKDHLAPKDGGEAVYKHRFGRRKPTLIYDTVNKKMELAGGGYDIPDEGIDK